MADERIQRQRYRIKPTPVDAELTSLRTQLEDWSRAHREERVLREAAESQLAEMAEERDRWKAALVRIAEAHSRNFGKGVLIDIARDALKDTNSQQ